MPGHVGTDIVGNSLRRARPGSGTADRGPAGGDVLRRRAGRAGRRGCAGQDALAEDLRQWLTQMANDFRDKAPLSAAQAATVILDGVLSGAWRILVGADATMIDERIRANPEVAYDYAELFKGLAP